MTKNPNDKKAEIVVSVDLLKKIGGVAYKILSIVLLVIVSFQLSSVYNVLDAIASMQYEAFGFANNGGTGTNTAAALADTQWFKNQTLPNTLTKDQLFKVTDGDYVVMFRASTCSYCVEAEKEIKAWLDSGKTTNKLFFVDTNANGNFWGAQDAPELTGTPSFENFYITGTPTFLIKEDGKFSVLVGSNQVAAVLGYLAD